MVRFFVLGIVFSLLMSCDYLGLILENESSKEGDSVLKEVLDSSLIDSVISDSSLVIAIDSSDLYSTKVDTLTPSISVDTKNVHPLDLINYAKTLYGIPYKYASTDPKTGFDCSGFITYVFNHFNIAVPRSSVEFTNVGKEISLKNAVPGDLILFTGTEDDSTYITRTVGHMGIITNNSDSLRFIHSSSGKANGVTITPLNAYYQKRFVKVIRIFP